ncbi:type I secretion system permease/ATPase [Mesorhizobium sp. VNQ89]|uniref:type I secretion system permease/ATPase n=1 Tax=Mesorhizobium quangtriensis TaxID=3157709 RepID=UPI0032B77826
MKAGARLSFPSGRLESQPRDRVGRAIMALRRGFAGLIGLSAVFNLFMLTGSLFMLQVYDRVLTSRSLPTLVALFLLVAGIYVALAALDTVRLRLATRIADWFGEEIGPSVASLGLKRSVFVHERTANPMQDFDRLRAFIGSPAAIALSDLPWLPIYLAVAFMFHPQLGVLALTGVLVLFAIAVIGDRLAQAPVSAANTAAARRARLVETGEHAAETITGLGMRDAWLRRYVQADEALRASGREASDRMAFFVAASRGIRLLLQSASLALGAWLALQNEITPGMIIAVSIITARALAPVEQAIGHWRAFVSARQGWARLRGQIGSAEADEHRTRLPRPKSSLEVADLSVAVPGRDGLLLAGINFSLQAGASLGVIGPSGAGKSTLARALTGLLPPAGGSIRLDGAELSQWQPDQYGRYIGYLPQDIYLFDGTVADNIARLATNPDPGAIIAAATKANAHDLIARLPHGYDTRLGQGGLMLSAGQRQRIGLARALFGSPFLIVLDEPTSALDAAGDEALRKAVEDARNAQAIVIVIAHRPGAIAGCDRLLVISEGRQVAFGARSEILREGNRVMPKAAAS